MVKDQIKVTPWQCTPTPPNQCLYHVSTSYTLRFLIPDKILKVKVTTTRSKVKSRSHYDVAQLQQLASVPAKGHYRSRSLQQDQRSNQGHTMTMHTYTH